MKRIISLITVSVIISSMFIGCGGSKEAKGGTPAEAPAVSASSNENVYPLKNSPKLKVWAGTVSTRNVASNADTLWAPELEKRTGVKIEWQHSSTPEQFNLMIASGDYPDIIFNDWIYAFSGGTTLALSNKLIIPLNEAIDKYAPNFKKFIKENPDVDKRMRTDGGKYAVFPTIRNIDELRVYAGPIIRKDWMDELSIKVPETMDDWYAMLTAFKEKKKAPAPLSYEKGLPFRNVGLIGTYGLYYGMFMDNGKIKYGPAEPAYKDFLAVMAKWYKEGLIDPDIGTVDQKVLDAKMTSDKSGAAFALLGGGMGTWMNTMKTKNPTYNLVGAPYPVLKKGDTAKIGQKSGVFGPYQAAISSSSKNVEAAVRWLDYIYGKEGHMLANFGVEGQGYTMVKDYPTYTDAIMKAPEGARTIMGKYLYANAAKVDDLRAFEQYSVSLPQQMEALKAWKKTDADKYLLPEIQPTPEETSDVSSIMNNINSYTNEMFFKFMLSQEPISKFDDYVAQLKKLELDKAISLQQKALDRYMKR